MHKLTGWLCAAASAALVAGAATAAQAAEPPLAWSFSSSGVGFCTMPMAANCSTQPGGGITFTSQQTRYDFGYNASTSAADPVWGLAHGSANPGVGDIALPELHADVTGAPFRPGAYAWNYSQVQGVQGFTWTGSAIDLDVNLFRGVLDYSIANSPTGGGYGQVGASIAILSSAIETRAIGDLWYPADGMGYGFQATCATAGAIAIGETGGRDAPGAFSVNVNPTCGSSTFHLETGDRFYLWARLSTFHLGPGFTDASDTFSVVISPEAAPEIVALLEENLTPTGPLDLGTSVPEPSTWAMLILGFGTAGAALRRRRLGAAA